MTNGKTVTVTEKLNSEEDFDALQEVTAELEQAEARIERLEAKLADAQWLLYDAVVQLREGLIKTRRNRADLIDTFLAELKGQDDE